MFQSPSLRGSGRFAPPRVEAEERAQVSIPLIAGQWSLRTVPKPGPRRKSRFQSPSLRGSGRFHPPKAGGGMRVTCFNPLHCGAVVASAAGSGTGTDGIAGFNPLHCGAVVASREGPSAARAAASWRFNPLHCGAVVASEERARQEAQARSFNPLHCGAVVASGGRRRGGAPAMGLFQSPSLRGSGRFAPRRTAGGQGGQRFNLSRASATPCR